MKKSKISVRKTNFFPRQLYKKLFLLFTFITLVILHTKFGSLWTTRPDKISIFLKIEKAKKSILPIEIRFFFLWKLGGPFFLNQSLPTLRILHTKFGLIWRTSWPDKNTYFKNSFFEKFKKFRMKYELFS